MEKLFYCSAPHTLISPLAFDFRRRRRRRCRHFQIWQRTAVGARAATGEINMEWFHNSRRRRRRRRRRFSPRKGCGRSKSSRSRFPNISSLIKAQRDERSALYQLNKLEQENWSGADMFSFVFERVRKVRPKGYPMKGNSTQR